MFSRYYGLCLFSALGISMLGGSVGLAIPTFAQPAQETDMDNIYHEDENLPDDADIFPRMGHLAGESWEQTNCRVSPWGAVQRTVSGDSFVEISDRTLDGNGESWFYTPDMNCWIHDSRIDLL